MWINALGLQIIQIYIGTGVTEVGPPHLRCGVGGAEVGPRWDRPTHLFVWGRGGIEVGPAHPRFRVGGTEVGPPHPRFIWRGPPTPFEV